MPVITLLVVLTATRREADTARNGIDRRNSAVTPVQKNNLTADRVITSSSLPLSLSFSPSSLCHASLEIKWNEKCRNREWPSER